MRRLLFTYLSPSSFVRDDLALLRRHFDVRPFHFDVSRARSARGLAALAGAQQAWLRRELPRADVVFGWFADYHMALPVWMAARRGVPSAVVLSGMDVNVVPSLGYGALLSRWRAPLVRYVARHAGVLLPVTPGLVEHDNVFAEWPRVLRNGVRAHVPGLATPCTVVPPGLDAAAWMPGPADRPPSVLTAGLIRSAREARLKGIDLLVDAARHLPDVPFRVVGVVPEVARTLPQAPNVAFLPPVARAALQGAYAEASVYAQLSRSEGGLPLVVAEAMLCGCVPVGSPVGGMPDVIGPVGRLVERPDGAHVAAVLRDALDGATPARRADARARVSTRYPMARREALLVEALEGLTR